ncbi:MAG: hypothetical protein HY901_30435 [Deltaproteobacteria bacterium]|nr:hypothetical protein [Deltaproteobacteria bacterium]
MRPAHRLLCLLTVGLALQGCYDPPMGRCHGQLEGRAIDAEIDAWSEHHDVQRTTCSERNRKRCIFSYGGGTLAVTALSPDPTPTTRLGVDQTLQALPSPAPYFEQFAMLSPRGHSPVTAGEVVIPGQTLKLSDRIEGTLRVQLADGSEVECSFDLPPGEDEGDTLDCPDEHRDHDHHYDDWD